MDGYTKVAAKTWFLEFPKSKEIPSSKADVSVERWSLPSADEYLQLFHKVGDDYGWTGRLLMEKAQLQQVLQKNERIHVFLFYVDGKEAGYFEINFTPNHEAEIVYLGLVPEFIGHGYGRSLIHEAVRTAYKQGVNRVWLHTCEYDHPKALEIYQKAGFVLYKETIENEYYPNAHQSVIRK